MTFRNAVVVQLLQKGFAKNPNKKKMSDILVNILITMK